MDGWPVLRAKAWSRDTSSLQCFEHCLVLGGMEDRSSETVAVNQLPPPDSARRSERSGATPMDAAVYGLIRMTASAPSAEWTLVAAFKTTKARRKGAER